MFKPIKSGDVPRRNSCGRFNRIRDIEGFIASGAEACEIILSEYERPQYVRNTLGTAINRRQYYRDAVAVVMRNNRVFLVRKNLKPSTEANNEPNT